MIFVLVSGSPETSGARATVPVTTWSALALASAVMKVESTEDFGQACQRTRLPVTAVPGWISLAATRTSVVATGGGVSAADLDVPPPSNPRTSKAAAPAASAASTRMTTRERFMGSGSFVPIRPQNPLEKA